MLADAVARYARRVHRLRRSRAPEATKLQNRGVRVAQRRFLGVARRMLPHGRMRSGTSDVTGLEMAVWKRALEGKPTVLLGAPLPPPPQRPHRLLQVDCAAWDRPLGPLLELRAELERLIEQTRTPLHNSRRVVEPVGDEPWSHIAHMINRLQRQLDCPLIVVLGSIEAADAASLQLLEGLLAGPMKLLAAVVMQSGEGRLGGRHAKLVELVVAAHGEEALVRVSSPPAEVRDTSQSHELHDLSVDVVRVLRAAAAVGDTFEADLVAGLLALDAITTLELLQMAIDQGVPLMDRGNGIFALPRGWGETLRMRTTPSLAAAWHADLAAMMQSHREPDEVEVESDEASAREEDVKKPIQVLADKWHVRDLASRAAEHAEASGSRRAAAMRYLEAAEEAASIGGHERAVELVGRALRLTSEAPVTDAERQLRLRVVLGQGRVMCRAAGSLEDLTLPDALAVLRAARELAKPQDPAELRAEINVQIARVAYDIGDGDRFELALQVLQEAQQLLLDDGQPLAAARLLNEAAAVHIRIGQLARAAELLARSREVFLGHADSSADARRELAETNHLVARLPLHGPIAGHDEELAFAIECARGAERTFAELNDPREQARVYETLGRLARLTGRPDEARRLLRQAYQQQRRLGDAVGLARTTAALADLLADAGQPDDALTVLGDSITLNLQLGSRRGVAYNLQGLADLEHTLEPDAVGVADAIRRLRADLQRATA